jgi:hypothetical protein
LDGIDDQSSFERYTERQSDRDQEIGLNPAKNSMRKETQIGN